MLEHYPHLPTKHPLLPRPVDIWLPPSYTTNPEQKYPVLYMHDGQNLFQPELSYIGVDWGIDPALRQLITAGSAAETIVVGVWNSPNRLGDYLPRKPFLQTPKKFQQQLKKLNHYRFEQLLSDEYLQFLVQTVKPFVDQHYRTLPGREHTFVMGSSMGGLISLYALCEYPHIFKGAGCVSTHWPVLEPVIELFLEQSLPPAGQHLLYFDYGTETLDALYEPLQKRADVVLESKGYTTGRDLLSLKFAGADHSERAWRERVHLPLQFLLGR